MYGGYRAMLPAEDFELNIYCVVVSLQWNKLNAPNCVFKVCIPVAHYLQVILRAFSAILDVNLTEYNNY